MRARDEEAFKEYVVARKAAMLRTAYLLSGDWHRAEDLVSTTVVKLYARWRKLDGVQHLDAYVRKVLVRVHLDEVRRPWRREYPVDVLPETADVRSAGDPAVRADLRALLARMPARQRAVLVLRYYDDLSIGQTAVVLGCSEGAVKTLTFRALDSIRQLLPSGTTSRTEYEESS